MDFWNGAIALYKTRPITRKKPFVPSRLTIPVDSPRLQNSVSGNPSGRRRTSRGRAGPRPGSRRRSGRRPARSTRPRRPSTRRRARGRPEGAKDRAEQKTTKKQSSTFCLVHSNFADCISVRTRVSYIFFWVCLIRSRTENKNIFNLLLSELIKETFNYNKPFLVQ